MNARSAHCKTEPTTGDAGFGLPAVIVGVFLLLCALAAVNQVRFVTPGGWLVAWVVLVGLGAAVASMVPVLPWPNALLAAGLAAFFGGMMESVSVVLAIPFGRREFLPGAGPIWLGLMPWWFPVAWGVFALSARGTARLILYRTRQHPYHGYRVIGLASVLAFVCAIGLEVFSTRAAHIWEPGVITTLGWGGMLSLHLFIQIAITPLLIDKFPGHRPPNFLPLWVWSATNLLLATGIVAALMSR